MALSYLSFVRRELLAVIVVIPGTIIVLEDFSMISKVMAVTGASGHIGKAVKEALARAGHTVRPVSRSAGVSVDDPAAIQKAFQGTDAAFLMIPPEVTAPDIRARQRQVSAALTKAVKAAGTRRVVFLSSIEAHRDSGTGPILGLHDAEKDLRALGIPELTLLRPTYFMENHLVGIGLIRKAGFYGSALRKDLTLPMIATRDIARKAADLLVAPSYSGDPVVELLGPREYTLAEATRILGTAIGKPDLNYVQFGYDDARQAMIAMGLSKSYADALVEMSRHFNETTPLGTQPRSSATTTSTTLEQFAQEVFRPAFESPTPSGH